MGGTRDQAGRVEVIDASGDIVWELDGSFSPGNFGESVAGLPDVSGDGTPDLVVGAGNDRPVAGGIRTGVAYILSGVDGDIVDRSIGERKFDEWGTAVAACEDVNR